jgi:Subtilase family
VRELIMKWFFQDRPAGNQAGQDDSNAPPGLIGLPEEVLERHGLRALDPSRAGMLGDDPTTYRPTIYRARTLLVPDHLLQNREFIHVANGALEGTGMALTPPVPDPGLAEGDEHIFSQELRELPRPAVLVPARKGPVVLDAWVALQALRAEAASPDHHQLLDERNVMQVGLEHAVIGSAITGSPIGNQGGGIAGGPGGASGASGPTTTDSYLFSGGDPRTPVAVVLGTPAYKSDEQCEHDYGRRPVVAVLDTGLGPHDWLGVVTDEAGVYSITVGAPVADDTDIQNAIYAEGQAAVALGDRPRRLIKDVWDKPMTANALVGELNDASGHGTFIAGIVRQAAPDARILAIRVMQSDDVAYEGDILCALRHLANRIALGAPGDVAAMTDVVSLSFGYFSESPAYAAETSALGQVINILLRLGVVVVAAAGNYATSRKFYPAAFAADALPGEMAVISVGALNPNLTKAVFSDDGDWVTIFAQGAAVLSTYPVDINASRSPELRMPVGPTPPGVSLPGRAALKPDDFTDGWAIWSGTSFSTPYVAALIIRSLQDGTKVPEGATSEQEAAIAELRLGQPGRKRRAVAAVENLRRQGNQGG